MRSLCRFCDNESREETTLGDMMVIRVPLEID